jgi:lysophospholipase L1-like esterase
MRVLAAALAVVLFAGCGSQLAPASPPGAVSAVPAAATGGAPRRPVGTARSAGNARDAAATTIAFFGDSITYGFGIPTEKCDPSRRNTGCYADLVSLAESADEANLGVPGSCLEHTETLGSSCDSAVSGIERYQSQLLPYCGSTTPTYVAIMLGTNDAHSSYEKHDTGVESSRFLKDLTTIVDACIASGIPSGNIVLAEIPYVSSDEVDERLVDRFNLIIRSVADRDHTRFAATNAATAPCGDACLSDDGVHPNLKGHALIAGAFEAAFDGASPG